MKIFHNMSNSLRLSQCKISSLEPIEIAFANRECTYVMLCFLERRLKLNCRAEGMRVSNSISALGIIHQNGIQSVEKQMDF